MGIRTYRARSMADAIDAVQRELGRDAIILHTRNYKVGGLFGFGGRPVVEVTASPASVVRDRHRGESSKVRPSRAASRSSGVRSHSMASPTRDSASRAGQTRSEPRPAKDEATSTNPTSAQHRRALLERYTALASAAKPAASSPEPGPTVTPEAGPSRPSQAVDESPESIASEKLRVRASAPVESESRYEPSVGDELRSLRHLLGRMMHTQHAGPVSASTLGEPLADVYIKLIEAEVDRQLADHLASRVRLALSEDELADASLVRSTVMGAFADAVPIATSSRAQRDGGPLVIALVGPTGVGKTTTVAKLAAAYKLRRGQRVGLITTDTFRIAAVEQLRTYASIISVPLRVVMSPAEMASACRAMSDCDVVLIDTAGRSPRDGQRLDELSGYLEAASPHETHLVLSSTAGASALRRAASGFAKANPDRVLFTKVDEADSVGPMVSMVHEIGLPLSFITTGQEVPDHIEPGRAERLARMLLGVRSSTRPDPSPEESAFDRTLSRSEQLAEAVV